MKVLLDALGIQKSSTRLCYEIIERNRDLSQLVLIGIQKRGDLLAKRMQKKIADLEGVELPLEVVDITQYRDDLKVLGKEPSQELVRFATDLNEKNIILVDDVLYTGRTIRAALDAILRQARPQKIQLACLIDRGHRELPIRADFIGKNIPTSREEKVSVYLNELDQREEVVLE